MSKTHLTRRDKAVMWVATMSLASTLFPTPAFASENVKRVVETSSNTMVVMIDELGPLSKADSAKFIRLVNKLIWTPQASRDHAKATLGEYGWNSTEWNCLDQLWTKESNWRHNADNPTSSAYGIPQLLGMNPGTPAPTQIELGLKYIKHRYDTPCRAWKFWQFKAGSDNHGGWY